MQLPDREIIFIQNLPHLIQKKNRVVIRFPEGFARRVAVGPKKTVVKGIKIYGNKVRPVDSPAPETDQFLKHRLLLTVCTRSSDPDSRKSRLQPVENQIKIVQISNAVRFLYAHPQFQIPGFHVTVTIEPFIMAEHLFHAVAESLNGLKRPPALLINDRSVVVDINLERFKAQFKIGTEMIVIEKGNNPVQHGKIITSVSLAAVNEHLGGPQVPDSYILKADLP